MCVLRASAANGQDETILFRVTDPGIMAAITNGDLDTCRPRFDNVRGSRFARTLEAHMLFQYPQLGAFSIALRLGFLDCLVLMLGAL